MWATFAIKAQKQLYKPSQSVSLIYELAWLDGILKYEENLLKTSCKAAPVTKVAQCTYFDDVTTIENNQQVRVNIDATLVVIFRIKWGPYSPTFLQLLHNLFVELDSVEGVGSAVRLVQVLGHIV